MTPNEPRPGSFGVMSRLGRLSIAGATLRSLVRELAQLLLAFGVYNLGRILAADDVARADDNARAILRLQEWLPLPTEVWIQAQLIDHDLLIESANRYYAVAHFPVAFGLLLWLFLRRRETYHWAKRSLLAATGIGMFVHMVVPVTPPRLLVELGMVDTALQGGDSVYAAPVLSGLSNEYAAMPSFHVGWALLVAIVLIVPGRTRWRWLWALHPAITLAVVVVTANHYWLDAVVGCGLVVGALWVLRPRRGAVPDAVWSPTASKTGNDLSSLPNQRRPHHDSDGSDELVCSPGDGMSHRS
ncbi:phosphatase PAP2 family protein [Nocardioides pacificus]